MYRALERRKGVETLLNVGPCTHKGCGAPFAPGDEPPGIDNIEAQEMHFFQRYLMGMEVPSLPRVRFYIQPAAGYVDTTAWPPPSSTFRRQYLGPETISPKRPAESSASYLTDPAAGLSMSFDQQGTVAITPYVPLDQRLEEEQGLTWRTPMLSQPLTLAGPIALHLVASSTATDTDWFAKVSDVAPDGTPEHRRRGAAAGIPAGTRAREYQKGATGGADHTPAAHSGSVLRLRNRDRTNGL